MNLFIHGCLGHFLMNEAGYEGGQGGGSATGADGQQQADGQSQQQSGADTLLGGQQKNQEGQQSGESSNGDGDQQANKADQSTKPVIPENYAFENLPDGYTLDETATKEWSAVFKDAGFTQDQVDKLVAMDAKRQQALVANYQQQAQQARQQQLGDWITELKADETFGGAKFDENVGIAQKALAEFGSPELSKALVDTGMGSHPEVVRLFHRIGQQLAEGQLHRGSGNQSRKSNEEVFYGKS